MASGSQNMTTYNARVVTGSNSAASPAGALLLSGAGRANDATGDTWIFFDSGSDTSTPWGIKHDQANNQIQIFGAGTNSVWTQMNTGNTYIGGNLNTGSTLTVRAQNNTHEGGELILNPATSSFVTIHVDAYDNLFRIHDGTNERFKVNVSTGNATVMGKLGINYNSETSGNSYQLYVNGSSYFTNTITGDALSAWHMLGGRPANTTNFNTYFETIGNLHHDNPARTDAEISYNRFFLSHNDQTTYGPSALNLPVVDQHVISLGIDNGATYSRHIAFDIRTNALYVRARNNNTWTNWEQIVRNTGTWGISITGNAATATTWQTARTLTIGNTGKSVNGSANVSWSKDEILGASTNAYFLRGDKEWSNTLNGNLTLIGNLMFSNSGTAFRGINYGTMGDNDQWRIGGAATAANAGYMELATADDGNEPIYVRQYTGVFTTVKRTLTLLDANGNSSFPGNITCIGAPQTMTAANMAFNGGIQLREAGAVGNAQSAIEYGPRISFHWDNRVAKSITLHSNGTFYFRDQNGTTRSTIDANVVGALTGNADTATKLGTATVGGTNRGIYLNAGTATAVSWYYDSCSISGGNQAHYPWHRFATCTTGAGQWTDKSVIVVLHSRYDGGPYGMVKLSMRTNATNEAKSTSAVWIYRKGFAVDDIKISAPAKTTGTDETINAYIKCGTYPRRIAYILEGSNLGWSLVSSNEPDNTTTSDKKGGTEINASVSGHNASDGATVSYANSAGSVAWDNVGSKPATATRWPTWSEVTSKPNVCTTDTAQTITGTKSWGTSGAGGQLNGAATNGGINSIRVGDDVWLGDCNAGGIMGMKSTGTNCGFYMYNSSGTQIGQLYFNGTNLVCNKTISANITGSSGSCTGNAATATKATQDADGNDIRQKYVNVYNTSNIGDSSSVTFTNLAAAGNAVGMIYAATDNPRGSAGWVHCISLCWAKGTSSSWISQIAMSPQDSNGMWYRTVQGNIAGAAWKRVLDSSNYTSYTVTKTGSGASGSWGISVTGSSASCTGNAATATKLATKRTINGTDFDGSAAITTANWGTARNITIKDASSTNAGTAVSVNGSGAITLLLPSTIKASITGNCSGSSGSCTMEIGRYIDFHGTSNMTDDHTIRFTCATNTARIDCNGIFAATGWSDLAEYRRTIEHEPGRAVIPTDCGIAKRATKRLQPGARIVSDTYGFCLGESDDEQSPIALTGRVLAYPCRPISEYHAGDAVCSGPNGTVDLMTREEIQKYPDCIIGIVNEIPTYPIWNPKHTDDRQKVVFNENVEVRGRIWIDVK